MHSVTGELEGIDYHQFYLCADAADQFPHYADDGEISPRGLIATVGPAVCVTTGIAMGVVGLTLEMLDREPPIIDDRRPWEAVTEISFYATKATASVRLLMDTPNRPFDDSFSLPGGLGWHRVRAHAIGRSLDFDLSAQSPPREHHLLQLWRNSELQPARHPRIDNPWGRNQVG